MYSSDSSDALYRAPCVANERAIISGRYLRVPCVYIWWRAGQALYVWSSRTGIDRPTSVNHHVIGFHPVEPTDEIECIFFPGYSELALQKEEDGLIRLLNPRFNRKGTWLQRSKRHVIRRLQGTRS